ncbi:MULTISPECIES: Uma2 family endonuclease [Kamptonema]|uniref:Uma2 family endonuclease n=1 Tax=Kamptonema TaxID=1501433 RepID=UPI0001DAD703|nr:MULTISPECIES: Uma2 family endonuclease [Kamptonema]CBN54193.1 conserved hypothetical protein [Kamptonema sp. PCC 6506]
MSDKTRLRGLKIPFYLVREGGLRLCSRDFQSPDFQSLRILSNGFLEGAPDLAVEILSPSNTVEEIDQKIVDYFDNGSRLVWVIHPRQKYVLVYRNAEEPDRLLKSNNSLDGEEIVPDFTLPIADLFQKLAF